MPLGQQQFGLQLLAAEANDHHLAAEIGIAGQVLQGADQDGSARRVDGDAAAIGMRDRHHVVDVGIFRQQLLARSGPARTRPCRRRIARWSEMARMLRVPTEPSALR